MPSKKKSEYQLVEHKLSNIKTNALNVDLLFCGHQKCASGHSFGPHIRSNYIIHYVVSGKGIFKNSHATYHLSAGCSFFIFPGEFTYYEADKDDPWEYYWLGFSERSIHLLTGNVPMTFIPDSVLPKSPVFLNTEEYDTVKIFKEMYKLSLSRKVSTSFKLISLFYELLYNYYTNCNEYDDHELKTDPISEKMLASIDYMKAHFREQVKITKIADSVKLSREHFAKEFKRTFGIPPVEYLIRYRLMVAASLLVSTDVTIEGISEYCGYTDYNYFSSQFHKYYKYSPTNYRKEKQ